MIIKQDSIKKRIRALSVFLCCYLLICVTGGAFAQQILSNDSKVDESLGLNNVIAVVVHNYGDMERLVVNVDTIDEYRVAALNEKIVVEIGGVKHLPTDEPELKYGGLFDNINWSIKEGNVFELNLILSTLKSHLIMQCCFIIAIGNLANMLQCNKKMKQAMQYSVQ